VTALTVQKAQCLVQQRVVTVSTAQNSIYGSAQLKGTGGNDCIECVRCEYFYGKSRLLKYTANKECLSLLFIAVLFVLFGNNGSKTSILCMT